MSATKGSKKGSVKKVSKSSSKKVPTAKARSIKSARGKASVSKGQTFEDDVAALYRLLGAEVVQNIAIANKKVDIFATFPYPRHRIIIECKDEKKTKDQNQRVLQFTGLLTTARKSNEADSAEIIARSPWGDAAKGAAHSAGIGLFTYREKLASLIDFTSYLKDLIYKYEKGDPLRKSVPPLGDYYVDLSAERTIDGKIEKIPIINTYINEWLARENEQHLAIFGEYGAGKSSLCQKIAHDMAEAYLNDSNSCRIPILLNLREFIGKIDIEAYITSFLDRECKVSNPKFELFRKMNEAGVFAIIFDGFDEMAVKVDSDTLETNLIEIDKLACVANSKLLLTSRPEYFITIEEERQAINPGTNLFKNREGEYIPLKILSWEQPQIDNFLKKRVPLVKEATKSWKYYQERINKIQSLADLSQRPVLLDMIVKTLPKLIETNVNINLPNLYSTYLQEELKRQRIGKKRIFMLSVNDRFSLLQELAADIYSGKIPAINYAEALERVDKKVRTSKQELEGHTRDFLTNSFLVRKGDEYIFSHKSILEYLIASNLMKEIHAETYDLFGKIKLKRDIIQFLKEFPVKTENLWKNLTLSRGMQIDEDNMFLAGNSITLLCAASKNALIEADLSDMVITGAEFSLADIRNANLKNTHIRSSNLNFAQYMRDDIKVAKLDNCNVLFYIHRTPQFSTSSSRSLRKDIERVLEKKHRLKIQLMMDKLRTPNGKIVTAISMTINDWKEIDQIKELLRTELSIDIAIYADERDQLLILKN